MRVRVLLWRSRTLAPFAGLAFNPREATTNKGERRGGPVVCGVSASLPVSVYAA